MASSSIPLLTKNEDLINWAELPPELTSSILLRLGMDDILLSVQKVCKSWRCVCKDPSMWRKIDMRSLQGPFVLNFDRLCREAVDLSQGGLLEINFSEFVSNDLLNYMTHRTSNLRSLALSIYNPMTYEGLMNVITRLPLLETLEISELGLVLNLKAIGHACPRLQTFQLNSSGYRPDRKSEDDYALAIAESMPQLRHLQLLGNRITDTGLNAILDNLLHLTHLDLRKCFNINFAGNLEKQCLERIKELRRPHDSAADCPYDIFFVDSDSDDDLEFAYESEEDEIENDLYGNNLLDYILNHY